jgi:probable F420-dependent oxidoreductase
MARIKFGAASGSVLPNVWAKDLERRGFDSAWVGEHVLMPVGGNEAFTHLGAMVGATEHITIGARVIVLPLRHPLMVAKAVTQLDIMSGGRFIFGVGIGGDYPPEFENLNVPLKERGRRTNESLEILERLWVEDNVTYEGKYYQVRDLTLTPRPVQQPHPPIWMGGRAPEAVDRAARFADGWFPNLNTVDGLRDRVANIKQIAEEKYHRDLSNLQIGVVTGLTVAKDHATALAEAGARGGPVGTRSSTNWYEMAERYNALGNAQDIIAHLEKFIGVGATHFVFNMSATGERLQHDLSVLQEDVLPYFRGND